MFQKYLILSPKRLKKSRSIPSSAMLTDNFNNINIKYHSNDYLQDKPRHSDWSRAWLILWSDLGSHLGAWSDIWLISSSCLAVFYCDNASVIFTFTPRLVFYQNVTIVRILLWTLFYCDDFSIVFVSFILSVFYCDVVTIVFVLLAC